VLLGVLDSSMAGAAAVLYLVIASVLAVVVGVIFGSMDVLALLVFHFVDMLLFIGTLVPDLYKYRHQFIFIIVSLSRPFLTAHHLSG